ncbi:MAG: FG-GAP repeat domain-containing protein [Bdellovibrionota bacterium]|jgi:hypothetical protein
MNFNSHTYKKLLFALTFSLLFPSLSFGEDAGTWSFGFVETQYDDSPNELVYHRYDTAGAPLDPLEFGKRNDLEVHGDYFGRGWNFGVIKTVDKEFIWTFKDSAETLSFGSVGDIIIGGCDFDGDNLDDLAYIRNNTLYFRSALDTTVTETKLPLSAGAVIENASCGDANGDGKDDLGVLHRRSGSDNIFALRVFDSNTGDVIFKRATRKVSDLFFADLNGDGLLDIALTRTRQNREPNSIIFYQNLERQRQTLKVPTYTDLVPYNFINGITAPSNALLLRRGRAIYAFDPLNKIILWQDLIPSDNKFLRTVNVHFTAVGDQNLCSEILPARDGAEGFLWKKSDNNGKVVVLLPTQYKNFSTVRIMKNDAVLEDLYFSGRANGNRQHWRGHKCPSEFPNNSLVVAQRRKKVVCWQIGESASRND